MWAQRKSRGSAFNLCRFNDNALCLQSVPVIVEATFLLSSLNEYLRRTALVVQPVILPRDGSQGQASTCQPGVFACLKNKLTEHELSRAPEIYSSDKQHVVATIMCAEHALVLVGQADWGSITNADKTVCCSSANSGNKGPGEQDTSAPITAHTYSL